MAIVLHQNERQSMPWPITTDNRAWATEERKWHLDGIRDQEINSATTHEQSLNDAQSYIDELEMEIYDAKQQSLVGRTALLSALGAFLIDANFTHLIDLNNPWGAFVGVPLLILPWLFYVRQWHKNESWLLTQRQRRFLGS